MLDKFKNLFSGKSESEKLDKVSKYVIIGASAAGVNAAKALRNLDKEGSITLISKDNKIYSRCMLHHVISGHRSAESINFVDENFMDDNNINWIKDTDVKNLDTDKKIVYFDNDAINYEKLLIATGASAFIPPIKKIYEGNYIYPLRNIEDVYDIKDRIENCKKVAIIGAGLIGIDALTALMEFDHIEVSLIYPNDFILDRQLDEYSAKVYENKFIDKGARLYASQPVNEIILHDNKDVKGVLLGDGTIVDCDMLIVSTGVKPNTYLVDNTDIENNRGIVINEKCETSVKDVYAAGDVVGKNAIWPFAVKQGIVAAYNMVGEEKSSDDHFTFKNSMNFFGIPTVSLGITIPEDESYNVFTRCDKDGYKKFVTKDDVITGFIAQGDISYTGPITYLIKNQVKIPNLKERIFDISYADFFSIKENGEFEYNLHA